MASSTCVVCHAFDMFEEDVMNEETGDLECTLRLWCLEAGKGSQRLVVNVKNFKPWCYVELPPFFRPNGLSFEKKWTEQDVFLLAEEMQKGRFEGFFDKVEFVYKSKFHYYQPQRKSFPMMRITFKSISQMRSFANSIESAARIPFIPNTAASTMTTSPPNGSKNASTSAAATSLTPRGRFYSKYFGRLVLRAWEADTSVSVLRKFMSITNLTFTGWFKVFPNEVIMPSASSEFTCKEVRVDASLDPLFSGSSISSLEKWWRNKFVPVPAEEALLIPSSSPSLLAFDIECYSHNPLAFPNPQIQSNTAYMISCVYQRVRDPSSRKRILITTNESSVHTSDASHPAYVETKTKVDEFVVVDDEDELIDALADVVKRYDPDIITGYNIHGFDYNYLDIRYRLLCCDRLGKWPVEMARNRNANVKIAYSKWRSSGYGFVESYVLTMEGRLSIDLLKIVKRNFKLSKYSLDFVSKHFIGSDSGKHDVTPKEMFASFKEAKETFDLEIKGERRQKAIDQMTRVAAYAMRDSELVVDLFEKLNVWIGLVELSAVAGVPIKDTFNRGEQCRVVSLLYDIASREDVILDKRKLPAAYKDKNIDAVGAGEEEEDDSIIKYTGGFVGDSVFGMHDNVICVDFASLYPSIMIADNISPDTFDVMSSPLEEKVYTGRVAEYDALVLKALGPLRGSVCAADIPKHLDSRYIFDKNSTPHNRIDFVETTVANNGTATKKKASTVKIAATSAGEEDGNGYEAEESDDDEDGDAAAAAGEDDDGFDEEGVSLKKQQRQIKPTEEEAVIIKSGTVLSDGSGVKYDFLFAKSTHLHGLVPRLVAGLVAERNKIRKKMGEIEKQGPCEDPQREIERQITLKVLNQRQLATKVTGNSAYGFLAAQRAGAFPFVEGAMTITAQGRARIKIVNEYIVNTYGGRILFNDTDSAGAVLPFIKSGAECNEWGHRLAEELTALFPPPLKLEFEKAMRVIFLAKKKYAALLINKDGSFSKDILIRGIVLARRDNCSYLRETYELLLRKILHLADAREILELTFKALSKALRGEVEPEKFEVVKALGSAYKQKNFSMAVFGEECAKFGRPAQPGDRLGYLIVTEPSSAPSPTSGIKINNLGLRMRLTEVWKELRTPDIDMLYYISNMFKNPIDQLFSVRFKEDLKKIGIDQTFSFSPRSNSKYSCVHPMKMLVTLVKTQNLKRRRLPNSKPLSGEEMADLLDAIVDEFNLVYKTSICKKFLF